MTAPRNAAESVSDTNPTRRSPGYDERARLAAHAAFWDAIDRDDLCGDEALAAALTAYEVARVENETEPHQ